jgi:AcrR family transcriptional regulator
MTITPPRASADDTASAGGTADAIRNAAIMLFARRGYEATTVNDIGRSVGIRGSAIYNHVSSKQELLRNIMLPAMYELVGFVRAAVESAADPPTQMRLAVGQHVRYHARCRLETRVGNREIPSLEEPAHTELIEVRRGYVDLFKGIIEAGIAEGIFDVQYPLIATHAILQSGMGVAAWFDPDGPMTDVDVGEIYGEFALRTLGYCD